MITMRRSIRIVFLAAISLLLVACGTANKTAKSGDAWKTYQKEKNITLGFDNTFVPMGYKDESGDNKGFDIDLAKAVFKQYGITVNFQAINWDLKEAELKNSKIDMIWNGYSMTQERQAKVAFTVPYMKNEQVIVVKKSSGITDTSDMKNKVLGAQSGSSGYDALTRHHKVLKDLIKDQDATQYETFTQAFIDLKRNRIDGLLIDKVYANYYLKQENQLDDYQLVSTGFDNEQFAVGLRKEDKTLQKKINEALKKMYQDGEFQAISQKWFGEDVATTQIKN
ncbi:amino acid ABC transporter substrate-binding protein [Streptococcus dysgalactiae]|uniref:amino acid ABC transporter substrate-binding protein n=1 Tax=Streptococcus dysgalactiae TaxID=1334 RepID=UPI000F6FA607|nr:amino acid ABC transporter substrate-binding protein [Streptococcus dysgalactiae]MEE3743603.1 amino acid ABC transporter substrate-binding protein [Streptococcus dysgalactiae]VDZ40498.1 Membrane-bound lytic murein transglycosylase F [Streptococcus dysgalactiae subsp. dysgalactiae]